MSMYLQEGHVNTLLRIVGAGDTTRLPGFVCFPPSRFQRLQQEVGCLRAIYLLAMGNLALCIVGKRLSYFRGNVRIEQQNSLSSLMRAIRERNLIIPLAKKQMVSAPLQSVCSDLKFLDGAKIHAKIGYNAAIVVFASHAGNPVVLHCPTSDDAERLVARHRAGIQKVCTALAGSLLEGMVPKLIDSVEAYAPVSIQSAVAGVAPNIRTLDSESYDSHLWQALNWILDLHALDHQPDKHPHLPSLDGLSDSLPDIEKHRIGIITTAVARWCSLLKPGSVLLHGDYWLGNVLFDLDSKKITGVVDWEWCELAGLPGLDALQLILMSRSRRSRRSLPLLLVEWFDSDSLDGTDKRAVEELEQTCGYNASDVRHLAMYLWLDTLRRGYLETQPENNKWLEEFIALPIPSFIAWLERHGEVCA